MGTYRDAASALVYDVGSDAEQTLDLQCGARTLHRNLHNTAHPHRPPTHATHSSNGKRAGWCTMEESFRRRNASRCRVNASMEAVTYRCRARLDRSHQLSGRCELAACTHTMQRMEHTSKRA